MPEWIIYTLGTLGAIQTYRILSGIAQVLYAWRRKINTQTDALDAAIEYQNIVWLAALEEETTVISFGKN